MLARKDVRALGAVRNATGGEVGDIELLSNDARLNGSSGDDGAQKGGGENGEGLHCGWFGRLGVLSECVF